MAFGCSIGQGLTGVSTLALGSFIAVAGILLGTTAGLRGALRVQPLAASLTAQQPVAQRRKANAGRRSVRPQRPD